MNNRSPRVVTIGNSPRRGRVGDRSSQNVIPASRSAMPAKKIATGVVQAIQAKHVHRRHSRPMAKPLAM